MKLSECTIGTIVFSSNVSFCKSGRIGWIVGLSMNQSGTVIPIVNYADGTEPELIHHEHITKYTELLYEEYEKYKNKGWSTY